MSVPAQRRSPREREELLSGAARAPDAARLFAFAAERMRRLVPYDAAVWRVTDPVNGMMTAPVHAEDIDGAECAAYWECELLAEKVNLFRDLARAPCRWPACGRAARAARPAARSTTTSCAPGECTTNSAPCCASATGRTAT